MKLGMSTATFFSKCFTEEAVLKIKELGVKNAEVFYATFSEYRPSFTKTLLKVKGDLNIRSVHALTNQFEPDLFSLNPRAQADCNTLFDKVITAGGKLGAEYYTFHGPTQLKKKIYNHDYGRLASIMNVLLDKAAEKNIAIAYENVHWCFFNNPEYIKNLLPRCPKLRTVLDIKQAWLSGFDYNRYLDEMGESLCNVHICDYDGGGKMHAPGKGTFDFKGLFKRLRSMNYNGTVMIELYAGDYDGEKGLRECVEYLRDLGLED